MLFVFLSLLLRKSLYIYFFSTVHANWFRPLRDKTLFSKHLKCKNKLFNYQSLLRENVSWPALFLLLVLIYLFNTTLKYPMYSYNTPGIRSLRSILILLSCTCICIVNAYTLFLLYLHTFIISVIYLIGIFLQYFKVISKSSYFFSVVLLRFQWPLFHGLPSTKLYLIQVFVRNPL